MLAHPDKLSGIELVADPDVPVETLVGALEGLYGAVFRANEGVEQNRGRAEQAAERVGGIVHEWLAAKPWS
jgi:hypothetical protein